MEVEIIKGKKDLNSVYNKRINVAAYARVSTKLEAQNYSLKSQKTYYEEKILRNKNWNFVKVYADDGISGRKLENRNEFIDMLNDAINGKIDLIITKSVSRFARNTYDLLSVVRTLKDYGVTIIFEEENINTSTLEGEMLLTVLAAVAQTESENISNHISYGNEMKRKSGQLSFRKKPYGYNYVDGKYVINKKEARVVKKMFELCLEGNTISSIANYLNKKKIKPQQGNKWNPQTISKFLRYKRFIGTYESGRNSIFKKAYILENNHEPIIDRDTWDKVQDILKYNKSTHQKYKFNNNYCGYCGRKVHLINSYGYKVLKCDSYSNNNKKTCPAKIVNIKYFEKCFVEVLLNILSTDYDYSKIKNEIIKLNNLKDYYMNEKMRIMDLYFELKINEDNYRKSITKIDEQLEVVNEKLNKIDSNRIDEKRFQDVKEQIINTVIDTVDDINEYSQELFEKLISFTFIGGRVENRYSNPYNICFYYDDKKELFDYKRIIDYSIIRNDFILYSYKKVNVKDIVLNENAKRKMHYNKNFKVYFFIRKDEK